MLVKLFLLFTIIPIAELYILVFVGEQIGTLNTIIIVVLTGMIGASFAKAQGGMVLGKIKSDLAQGMMPRKELMEGGLILAGGIMLITPGIMTDALGFSLIFPLTRMFYSKILFRYFTDKFTMQNYSNYNQEEPYNNNSDDDNIIDV